MKKSIFMLLLIVSSSVFSQSKENIIVLTSKSKSYSCGDFCRMIYFDSGEAVLNHKTKEKLDMIVKRMKTILAINNFKIEGHTDNKEKRNKKLSERRAENVFNYLVANGISATRVSSKGQGKEHPIADNKTKEGRTQNRRVEIKLIK